jgi:hypothetical protein
LRRSFEARVHIYSTAGLRLVVGNCLLFIDVVPFARTAWGGELTDCESASGLEADGLFLLRLPGGAVRPIRLWADAPDRFAFTGEGDNPI